MPGGVRFTSSVPTSISTGIHRGTRRSAEHPDVAVQVLDLVARGLTNAAIASRLHLSDKTVRNHVSGAFAKLHVQDRAAAVTRARDAGYGRAPGAV